MTKKITTNEAPYHYYASTAAAWAVGETRAEAIKEVLDDSAGLFKPNADGGVFVYSVRIELPKTATYEIESFVPKDVPLSDAKHGSFKMFKGAPILVARVED